MSACGGVRGGAVHWMIHTLQRCPSASHNSLASSAGPGDPCAQHARPRTNAHVRVSPSRPPRVLTPPSANFICEESDGAITGLRGSAGVLPATARCTGRAVPCAFESRSPADLFRGTAASRESTAVDLHIVRRRWGTPRSRAAASARPPPLRSVCLRWPPSRLPAPPMNSWTLLVEGGRLCPMLVTLWTPRILGAGRGTLGWLHPRQSPPLLQPLHQPHPSSP